MAACKRAGTWVDSGRRAASARSMRSRQASSCAANSAGAADSSCTQTRRSAASFTRRRSLRTGGSRTLPMRVLNFTERNRSNLRGPRAGGIFYGQVRRHRPLDPGAAHPDLQSLERMTERIIDRGAFEAAMRHAVVAARILAHAVLFPFGVFDQRLIGGRIALVGQEVAGPLPTEQVVSRIAPRRALIGLVAGQKIQEQRRVI